jgi:uncharacterized DUF497 family protein
MKYINWDSEKNEQLKKERDLSFEEIVYAIDSGKLIAIEKNPSRPDQKIFIVEIEGYMVVVPYVENEREIFLKTAFPSRKYQKKYGVDEGK